MKGAFPVTMGLLLAGWTAIVWLPLRRMQTVSYTPLRETAAVLRQAQSTGAAVFAYGFGGEALQYYLPTLPYSRDEGAAEALTAALTAAQSAGHSLVVAVGYEELNRLKIPAGFALLDDSARFTEISRLKGIEPPFTYRVLKSAPSTADGIR